MRGTTTIFQSPYLDELVLQLSYWWQFVILINGKHFFHTASLFMQSPEEKKKYHIQCQIFNRVSSWIMDHGLMCSLRQKQSIPILRLPFHIIAHLLLLLFGDWCRNRSAIVSLSSRAAIENKEADSWFSCCTDEQNRHMFRSDSRFNAYIREHDQTQST